MNYPTIKQARIDCTAKLQKLSPTPELDTEILISFVLSKPREYLFSHSEEILNDDQLGKLENLISRRLKSEPIAYIIGYQDFMGLRFVVSNKVLIPRPETEGLVNLGIEEVKSIHKNDQINLYDIGTGSGAIIISMYHLCTRRSFINIRRITAYYASDISPSAMAISKENADNILIKHDINFIESDLFESKELRLKDNSVVVSNLPYIPTNDYLNLDSSVKSFEPESALDGGCDGAVLIKKIIDQVMNFNAHNITILFEIDPSQAELLRQYTIDMDLKEFSVIKDFRGLNRYVRMKIA